MEKRIKASYVGAPGIFKLDLACRAICEAFSRYGCYLVGSSLERADWRDVDVRLIMSDEEFASQFPAVDGRSWELDSKWLLTTIGISMILREQTGLPIDFQIQPQTHANERHPGPRHALGMKMSKT